jgi:hypothetical protein
MATVNIQNLRARRSNNKYLSSFVLFIRRRWYDLPSFRCLFSPQIAYNRCTIMSLIAFNLQRKIILHTTDNKMPIRTTNIKLLTGTSLIFLHRQVINLIIVLRKIQPKRFIQYRYDFILLVELGQKRCRLNVKYLVDAPVQVPLNYFLIGDCLSCVHVDGFAALSNNVIGWFVLFVDVGAGLDRKYMLVIARSLELDAVGILVLWYC